MPLIIDVLQSLLNLSRLRGKAFPHVGIGISKLVVFSAPIPSNSSQTPCLPATLSDPLFVFLLSNCN